MNPNRYQPNAAAPVAQIFNLLYRRIAFGKVSATVPASAFFHRVRHSRTQSSAGLQPAVSPICNRQTVESSKRVEQEKRLAECNSAIQQVPNLRYDQSSPRATIPGKTDRVQLCATSAP